MHELSIAADLVKIVLDTASAEELASVTRVNVTFGKMVQIVPHVFENAFRVCVKGSVAEEALLDMEILPVKAVCMECNEEYFPQENHFSCSKCGSGSIKIIQGKELFVKSIEGE